MMLIHFRETSLQKNLNNLSNCVVVVGVKKCACSVSFSFELTYENKGKRYLSCGTFNAHVMAFSGNCCAFEKRSKH